MWLAPWMTVWRVLNRLRSIAEHGGLEASDDRRQTTHVVKQSWAARFWIVPFNTGWHLAHHVDMGVPFATPARAAPRAGRRRVDHPELEYPRSYRDLWKRWPTDPSRAAARRRLAPPFGCPPDRKRRSGWEGGWLGGGGSASASSATCDQPCGVCERFGEAGLREHAALAGSTARCGRSRPTIVERARPSAGATAARRRAGCPDTTVPRTSAPSRRPAVAPVTSLTGHAHRTLTDDTFWLGSTAGCGESAR